MLKYTEDHEWLKQDGDEITVGITAHASEQLGDVVFIELPEVGREVAAGEEIVVIESVKAASDIVAPVAGVITAVNEALPDQAGHHAVPARHLAHPRQQRRLGQGRPVQNLTLPDPRRNRLRDQRLKVLRANRLQHLLHLGRRRADMPAVREIVRVIACGLPASHECLPIETGLPASFVCKYPRGVRGADSPPPSPGRKARQGISRSAPDSRLRP